MKKITLNLDMVIALALIMIFLLGCNIYQFKKFQQLHGDYIDVYWKAQGISVLNEEDWAAQRKARKAKKERKETEAKK